MRKLALTLSALGFIAFTGVAHADEQKQDNSSTTDSSTTITGKHKVSKKHSETRPDGTTVESKSETITPKDVDKRDLNDTNNGTSEMNQKVERKDTLGGKHEIKTTKDFKNPDGTEGESSTTVTEPKK